MSMSSIIAQLQELIDESNETTGKSDTDLTTAVERLIRGWGGSTVQITEKDVTISSSSEYLSFECTHQPDIIAIAVTDWDAQNPVNGAVGMVVYKETALGYKRYDSSSAIFRYSTTTQINSTYPYGEAGGNGLGGGTYENGSVTMRARGSGGWAVGHTFHCIAITF